MRRPSEIAIDARAVSFGNSHMEKMNSTRPGTDPGLRERRRLGELLLEAGLVDETHLSAALAEQRKWGGRLGRTLVEMGFVTEEAMATALSRHLGIPEVDLDRVALPSNVAQLLRVTLAERYGVVPLGGDEQKRVLKLAAFDPTHQEMLKDLAFQTGMRIEISVAGASAIDRAIRRYYYGETQGPKKPAQATPATESRPASETLEDLLSGATLPTTSASSEALERRLTALAERIDRLERGQSAQLRVMKAMLELLLEKVGIGKDEWLDRLRRTDG